MLVLSGVAVAVALATRDGSWAAAAAVLSWATGALAFGSALREIRHVRYDAGADRAEQARRFTDVTRERRDEHARVVAELERQIVDHRGHVQQLLRQLVSTQARAQDAEAGLTRAARRVRTLDHELASLRGQVTALTDEIVELTASLEQSPTLAGQAELAATWAPSQQLGSRSA